MLKNIKNFFGMGDFGFMFVEGFTPKKLNGQSLLRQIWSTYSELTQDTTGFSDHNLKASMTELFDNRVDNNEHVYAIGKRIISRYYALDYDSAVKGTGKIHEIDDGQTLKYTNIPGILDTETGNLLYTSGKYLNIGVFGTTTSDVTSTKLVDVAGRDLSSDFGIAVDDVIVNMETQGTAVVTSITTTTSTNDTLNFSAGWASGAALAIGDYWAVFVDGHKTLIGSSDSDDENIDFNGQDAPYTWSRQIVNGDGDYFIGNGNYVAKLSNDETTIDTTHTQLKSFMQFMCMDYNNGYMLIGGDIKDRGKLLLWDLVTQNKYNSEVEIQGSIRSIKKYLNGWVVVAGRSVYYTNGYDLKKLANFPGVDDRAEVNVLPDGMSIIDDTLVINGGYSSQGMSRYGIWNFDLTSYNWEFTPFRDADGFKQIYGATSTRIGGTMLIGSKTNTRSQKVLTSYEVYGQDGTAEYTLASVKNTMPKESMIIGYFNTINKEIINTIDITLARSILNMEDKEISAKVTVAVADGSSEFYRYVQNDVTASSKNIFKFSGLDGINHISVGDMVMVTDMASAGEIAFITDIDSDSRIVTVDRDFTNELLKDCYIQVFPFKKIGENTISSRTITNPIINSVGRQTDGVFYFLIHIENTGSENTPLEIRNININ